MLEQDRQAPRKQRHTAHRIYARLCAEQPQSPISERRSGSTCGRGKQSWGWPAPRSLSRRVTIGGSRGKADWYEAAVDLAGECQVAQVWVVRSMAGGAAHHRAYPRATQQAFLDAHQHAFHYFGGVFRRLRATTILSSAVKKILRGHQRQETTRFIAFRSHWQFEAVFCTPAQGHEKGGVEGEVGYFRRNHLVPIPQVASWDHLNARLLQACRADEQRVIQERALTVGQALALERPHLLPLPAEDLDLTEEQEGRVDGKGCVPVRTNGYSTPLPPGTQAGFALPRPPSRSGMPGGRGPATRGVIAAGSRYSTWSTTWTCWSTSPGRWPGPPRWRSGGQRDGGRRRTIASGPCCGNGRVTRTVLAK